jgi:GTPase SAR1 family protein
MYDLTRSESFYNLNEWLSEIRANSDPDVAIYLVGNRYDEQEEREISEEDGQKFMKENNLQGFRESSAKTGHNVDKTFEEIAAILMKSHADRLPAEDIKEPTVVIRPTTKHGDKKKSCC